MNGAIPPHPHPPPTPRCLYGVHGDILTGFQLHSISKNHKLLLTYGIFRLVNWYSVCQRFIMQPAYCLFLEYPKYGGNKLSHNT